jgi:hypothetical protein
MVGRIRVIVEMIDMRMGIMGLFLHYELMINKEFRCALQDGA